MKKLILLFSTLSLIVFLNSCLQVGEETRSGNGQLFYITQSDGVKIAINGYMAMTSEEIKSKELGRWYFITWSWTATQGVSEKGIYNASTPDIEEVPEGSFFSSNAPTEKQTSISNFNVVSGVSLTKIFGNSLLFTYSWDKAEGESAKLKMFYEINTEKINNSVAEPIVIDVRLEKTGTASGTAKPFSDIASINMSELANVVQFSSTDNYKDISVKFRYNKGDGEGLTQPVSLRVFKD